MARKKLTAQIAPRFVKARFSNDLISTSQASRRSNQISAGGSPRREWSGCRSFLLEGVTCLGTRILFFPRFWVWWSALHDCCGDVFASVSAFVSLGDSSPELFVGVIGSGTHSHVSRSVSGVPRLRQWQGVFGNEGNGEAPLGTRSFSRPATRLALLSIPRKDPLLIKEMARGSRDGKIKLFSNRVPKA